MSKPFYSVKQVAELLSIRTRSVRALLKSGDLVGIDVSLQPGGRPRYRISQDDLDNFLLRRAHQAAPPRKRRRKKRPLVKQYF